MQLQGHSDLGNSFTSCLNITPAGTVNSSNVTFTLPDSPVSGTLTVQADGIIMQVTTDYTISGAVITMVAAPTQWIAASYIIPN